jgi:hypothetical protein
MGFISDALKIIFLVISLLSSTEQTFSRSESKITHPWMAGNYQMII